jgi:hypothetical protein
MKPRQHDNAKGKLPRNTRRVIVLTALLAAVLVGCEKSTPDKAGEGESSVYVAEGDRFYHAKDCAEVTSSYKSYASKDVIAEGYEPCPVCQGKAGTRDATRPSAAQSADARPPYALTPEQAATYKPLNMALVLSRSPDMTPQESNQFSAFGIQVDGITTVAGRRQFVRKMVELFGEQRAREIGAVFYDDEGRPTHAWPKPLENQPGSAVPFPEE